MFSEAIQSLERAFTDPSSKRIFFAVTLVSLALSLNYCTGFTHHYDTSSEIQEIRALSEIRSGSVEEDKELQELYRSALRDVQRRQEPLMQRFSKQMAHLGRQLATNLPTILIRVASATFIFVFWLLYVLIVRPPEVRSLMLRGLTPFFIFLLAVAWLLPEVGTIGGTAAVLTHLQLFLLFSVAIYGGLRRKRLSEGSN